MAQQRELQVSVNNSSGDDFEQLTHEAQKNLQQIQEIIHKMAQQSLQVSWNSSDDDFETLQLICAFV